MAPAVEKNGTFVNWEGRVRPFGQAHVSRARTDRQVLGLLARQMGHDLGVDDLTALHAALADLGLWTGPRTPLAPAGQAGPGGYGAGSQDVWNGVGLRALLATHKPLLDAGRLQDGEPFLAATAKAPVVRVGTDIATSLSLGAGESLTVSTSTGSVTLPAVVGGVADGVVWLPECSPGSTVHQTLGARHGSVVGVSRPSPSTPSEVVR